MSQPQTLNLQDTVLSQILKDDSYREMIDCLRIKDQYEQADVITKAVIDDIFISLTGWRLITLINNNMDEPLEDDLPFLQQQINGLFSIYGFDGVLIKSDVPAMEAESLLFHEIASGQ